VTACNYGLAVRIWRAFAGRLGIVEGSAMEISASENSIALRKPVYTLESLLERLTPENLHGETETGRPVGREEW
jgi:antitoxin MazE